MCLAVAGKVLEIVGEDPLLRAAKVSFAGVVKLISLTCTPEAKVGDFVLVHVGVAISVVDPQEAEETFRYLQQMGELDGLEIPTATPVGAVAPNGQGRLGASAPTLHPTTTTP
jgi:hydrogenase expression/formation protein HypC